MVMSWYPDRIFQFSSHFFHCNFHDDWSSFKKFSFFFLRIALVIFWSFSIQFSIQFIIILLCSSFFFIRYSFVFLPGTHRTLKRVITSSSSTKTTNNPRIFSSCCLLWSFLLPFFPWGRRQTKILGRHPPSQKSPWSGIHACHG